MYCIITCQQWLFLPTVLSPPTCCRKATKCHALHTGLQILIKKQLRHTALKSSHSASCSIAQQRWPFRLHKEPTRKADAPLARHSRSCFLLPPAHAPASPAPCPKMSTKQPPTHRCGQTSPGHMWHRRACQPFPVPATLRRRSLAPLAPLSSKRNTAGADGGRRLSKPTALCSPHCPLRSQYTTLPRLPTAHVLAATLTLNAIRAPGYQAAPNASCLPSHTQQIPSLATNCVQQPPNSKQETSSPGPRHVASCTAGLTI